MSQVSLTLLGLAGPPGAGKNTIGHYLFTRHDFARCWRRVPSVSVREHIRRPIVVIDITDEAEAAYLRNTGGQIWLIQRPGALTVTGSAYKGIMPHRTDRGILNDGTLGELRAYIDMLLAELQQVCA